MRFNKLIRIEERLFNNNTDIYDNLLQLINGELKGGNGTD